MTVAKGQGTSRAMIARLKYAAAVVAIPGCAAANAQQLHLYSKQEQAGMSHDGSIATMTTPSEIRELFKNAGKTPKPTGHVAYCNAVVKTALDGKCVRSEMIVFRRDSAQRP